MNHDPDDKSKSTAGAPLHPQDDWVELERALREPVTAPDDPLCNRIMEDVRRSAPEPSLVKPPPMSGWFSRWGVVGAMGAAATLAILAWLQPWKQAGDPTTQAGGTTTAPGAVRPTPEPAPDLAAIRREQDLLVDDTRKIASFLQENLRL